MYSTFLFLLVNLAIGTYCTPTSYITGGTNAGAGAYPFVVSIRFLGQHICTGSIIDNRNILTSATCAVLGRDDLVKKHISIHAGTNLLWNNGATYRTYKFTPHADYSTSLQSARNDIGIITLSEDIVFLKEIQPVKLATKKEDYTNKTVTTIGWGAQAQNGTHNARLQQLELMVVPQKNCELVFTELQKNQMCAWMTSTGICDGDSGAPLMYNGVQIGIASYGYPCATGVPDVYTRVGYFADWIEKNKSNSGNVPFICSFLLLLPLISILS